MLSPESQQSIDVDTGVTKINMVTHEYPAAGGMWAVLETKQSEFHWSLFMKILQLRMEMQLFIAYFPFLRKESRLM
jgi:hypothetical protein